MNVLQSIREMRARAKQADTKYYTTKGGKNMNPGDFNEGKTVIRVAPSHNPEIFPSPFVPFRSTYLNVELNINQLTSWNISKLIKEKSLMKQLGIGKIEELKNEDDKIKNKLKEILGDSFQYKVKKRVFISTLHGRERDKDLVEEYIKFVVQQISNEISDRDESRKRLSPIFGYQDGQSWYPGINPSTNFVFYGWDWSGDKSLYKIEIYSGMMNSIEDLYIKFDDDDKTLTIDPFSDIEMGIGLLFNKQRNEKGKWVFSINDVPYTDRSRPYVEFIKSFNISEEQLKVWKEIDSLQKQYGYGTFKISDFKIQLNGLILFDSENDYNIFENDDFLKIVEEISNQYSEEEPEQNQHLPFGDDVKKTGTNIVKKQLNEEKGKVAVNVEVENEDEIGDEELKAAMALIKKSKANKIKTSSVKKASEIKENSFKEENSFKGDDIASSVKLSEKLAMLRKNLAKK